MNVKTPSTSALPLIAVGGNANVRWMCDDTGIGADDALTSEPERSNYTFGESMHNSSCLHRIQNADGIRLALHEKRPEGSASRAILLLHSATFSCLPEYDLNIRDYSLMKYMADRGIDVFALDIRGYGNSEKPSRDDWVGADVAIGDVDAAVKFMRANRHIETLTLFGWSWGSQVAGLYAQTFPQQIDRIALAAPFWNGINVHIPDIQQSRRTNTARDAVSDFLDVRRVDADVMQKFAQQCMMLDQETPTGSWRDLRRLALRPILEPEKITLPSLILYGKEDHLILKDDVQRLYETLSGKQKRIVAIEDADHMAHLEKHKGVFHEELYLFTNAGD